ncbi:hypothetical protein FVE85_2594 [Porphyridium purpureum]|uniref:Uncharacterized protein n=1 Tax=Porphyridium purpureum TaxID=35688 RepID=A0A5J4YJL0_PORPP|nr:hypothetical protein FVE85_2594 [Porphyridium purpureum]|eukprot:POR5567..scf291_13
MSCWRTPAPPENAASACDWEAEVKRAPAAETEASMIGGTVPSWFSPMRAKMRHAVPSADVAAYHEPLAMGPMLVESPSQGF